MVKVSGDFTIYDGMIRIEYDCELTFVEGQYRLYKKNIVDVFVCKYKAYDVPVPNSVSLDYRVLVLARNFYPDGKCPEEPISINDAIEKDAASKHIKNMHERFAKVE